MKINKLFWKFLCANLKLSIQFWSIFLSIYYYTELWKKKINKHILIFMAKQGRIINPDTTPFEAGSIVRRNEEKLHNPIETI